MQKNTESFNVYNTCANEIKNQILDGKIKNNKDEALKLLTKLGKSKGLKPIK